MTIHIESKMAVLGGFFSSAQEAFVFNKNHVDKRRGLLEQLKGKGRFKYSRYNGLPLRYAGGKSLAVGYVVEQLPVNLKKLVSPFFGGGSVEIACSKELGVEVVGYDIFDILVNYWQVQLQEPRALADALREWKPTQLKYKSVKNKLKKHWTQEQAIEDSFELALHYWFNHNLSYGPGFLGWMSKIYEDSFRYERMIGKVEKFCCSRLSVAKGNFEETIAKHKKDFLYCDPPYYLGQDSKMFRGIYPQRNFPVHHNNFNHEKLRDLLYAHKGGFVLSYNDCDAVREWYRDYKICEVQWQYTLGQGETRIGKNRKDWGTDHVKKSHELLVVSHG